MPTAASFSAGTVAACACRQPDVVQYGRSGWVLVVYRDCLFWDGPVVTDMKAGAERPVSDFAGAGLPAGAGDLGARLAGPGYADGFSDEVGGAAGSFHGQFGEHGGEQLVCGLVPESAQVPDEPKCGSSSSKLRIRSCPSLTGQGLPAAHMTQRHC